MACYHPWQRDLKDGLRQRLPCGQCIGCRLERSRQWAVRMMHEASLHDENCFVTLTYDDMHLPLDGSLDKTAFPVFMRKLRKRGVKARYFHCGEYGERGRPHYHACIFGFSFPDKVPWTSRNGIPVHRSALLEECWSAGLSEIGSLTFESAAYVARYVTKKITGSQAAKHYERVDPFTGEMYQLEPEFATMSRNPGIGRGWFEKFGSEVFPHDEVIVRGVPARPPRYYDQQLSEDDLAEVKRTRERRGFRKFYERGAKRLHVREVCTKARLNLSPRSLD